MNEWKTYCLEDLIHIKHGYAFKGEFFSEVPTNDIIVTPGNFCIGGGFKTDKLKYYNGDVPKGYILSAGDVILTMTDLSKQADTLGYAAKVPFVRNRRFLHNQRIGLVNVIDPSVGIDFLYWLMRTKNYQKAIAGSATGSTVKHTSPTKIYAFKFRAPKEKKIQNKIASILSAYDDLIENNARRIKLLEELALRTYEEWFVKFRINSVQLDINEDSGLPEGWSKLKLIEVANLTMGQSPKSEFYNQDKIGLPFHQGVKDYGNRFPVNTCWSTSGLRNAFEGDILFSVRAPVGRINVAMEKMILGRGLASVNHKKGFNSFLLYQLQNIFFKDDIIGGGAIFNSVTKSDVERIQVVQPEKILEKSFNDLITPIDKQILNLTKQNIYLKECRDILLPRLMNGEIDIKNTREELIEVIEKESV